MPDADVLTLSIDEGILISGVQDASSPRTGPSPPERHCDAWFKRISFSPDDERTTGLTKKEVRYGRSSLSSSSQP